MYEILSGAIMMGCLVVGIFFLSFWRRTHERLFLMFGSSFFIMAVERFVLGVVGVDNELGPKVYFIRLIAFVLILVAIVQKNREVT